MKINLANPYLVTEWMCKKCSRVFKSEEEAIKHLREEHGL